MRPEVGTQAQFKKKLPPKKYRYDDSLSPALDGTGRIRRVSREARRCDPRKLPAEKLKAQLRETRRRKVGSMLRRNRVAKGDEQAVS